MNILTASKKQLEKIGFKFIWAESAYRVCVRYEMDNGKSAHVGTYDAHNIKAFSIPREAREDMEYFLANESEADNE